MPARTIFLIRSDGPNWDGLRAALDSTADVTVVGDTRSAVEARERAPNLRPAIIVSAATVEGESAVPLLSDLRAALPDAIIVLFAGGYTDEELMALAPLHLSGCLLWNDLEAPTFPAAHDMLRGGRFTVCSREVEFALIDALLRRQQLGGGGLPLSDQERAVLTRVAEGEANKAIAQQLHMSRRTVEDYVARLMAKLGARNRTHLTALAVRRGLTGT